MQKENSAKQQDVYFWLRQTYIQYIEDSVYIMYLLSCQAKGYGPFPLLFMITFGRLPWLHCGGFNFTLRHFYDSVWSGLFEWN